LTAAWQHNTAGITGVDELSLRSTVLAAPKVSPNPPIAPLTAQAEGNEREHPGRPAVPVRALLHRRRGPRPRGGPTRVYFGPELDKLDVECRGFLLFLEQHGILDGDQRELVLDRAMALDQEELDLDDLKWVVLMVLFNQPGSEAAYAWMETQMFADEPEPVH
jgi:hypothetical protein